MVDSRALAKYQPRLGHQPESERSTVWRDEILQVIPASGGWWATFTDPSHREVWFEPVCCWAIKRTVSGRVAVVPLIVADGGVELAEPESTAARDYLYIESGHGRGGD